jgi:hypothetical protein
MDYRKPTRRRPTYRVAPFAVDITPPVGHPIAYGVNEKVDSPLYLRGVVLDDGTSRAVLASADYIFLWGGAHHRWQRVLGRAAGARGAQVLLHVVHQHDSVMPAPEADDILVKHGFERRLDPAYWRETTARVEEAVRRAGRPGKRGSWRRVHALATAERRVSGLASNRRLVGEDGKVWGMRFSMTTDERMQAAPVGVIDPVLRTIGFLDGRRRPIACLHYYATHPMAAYLRNMASADVPGRALDYVRRTRAGGSHVYFTGCGANVTFGKYVTRVKEKSLSILGDRLGRELAANTKALRPRDMGRLSVRRARFVIPRDRSVTKAKLRRKLRNAKTGIEASRPARLLALLDRWKQWGRPWVTRLSLGPRVHMLSLPSEVVVEYQLFAQSLLPEHFLACAAYSNATFCYIPTAVMYEEGGYEPAAGIWTPEVEQAMKEPIRDVLRPLR